ncbi:Mitochondrial substrate carrier family protein [Abeliophyllum distichum]|uniref:Mitochondrial substrate carrier family protein n=1 Tax=Abeliophyllum distichum TaxID=126358 RepID=A0ABD1R056_9LAMI
MSTNTTGSNSLVFRNSDCYAETAQPLGSVLSEDAHFDLNASTCAPCLEMLPVPKRCNGALSWHSSNIASSAPISAVYTFTYESVKSTLIPFFPKEYQSLAHCLAGGCASIATSFIISPSERIKQQMQVGSHYRAVTAGMPW